MANSLGQLVVKLALDAAEFTSGLTKSEYQAKKWAESIDKGIATAAKGAAVAIGAMAAAAAAGAVAFDQLVKQAGNFKDLEEITGANAEMLASFAVSAAVAGTEMQTIADASVKLSKNLVGVDDEGKAAGAALAALGLNIKEFKELSPADQIVTLAQAFAQFEDGASKTAVAVALLSKSGAALLPFMKELASAGGRQVILTQKQIELADEYADKQARTRAELNLYAQSVATRVIPAIQLLTETTKEFIGELIGVDKSTKKLKDDNSVESWARTAIEWLAKVIDAGQLIGRIFQAVGETIAARAAQLSAVAQGEFKRAGDIGKDAEQRIQAILSAQTFSQKLAAKTAVFDANEALRAREDRGFKPPGRQLQFSGAEKDSKIKEKTDATDKYIESLLRQQEATLDLDEVTKAELMIYDLALDAESGLTEAKKKTIRTIAEYLKWNREANEAAKENAKAAEDAARAESQFVDSRKREADGIRRSNEATNEQIILLTQGEDALFAYQQAKLLKLAAEKDDEAAMLRVQEASERMIKSVEDLAKAYRERAAVLEQAKIAEKVAKDTQAIGRLQEQAFDIGINAIDRLMENYKDWRGILDQLGRDILRFVSSEAVRALKNMWQIGPNSGPTLFDVLGKILGIGVSAYAGGGTAASAVPGSFTGPNFGGYAGGTMSARRGWAVVGENGPEVVRMNGGERVYNTAQSRGMGTTLNQTVNVMVQGTVSRATSDQIGRDVGRHAQDALKR